MRRLMILAAVLFLSVNLTACAKDLAVGPISEKEPPSTKELVEPKSSDGIDTVDLRETVAGEVGEHARLNYYVMVNPLSNPATHNTWWVQDPAIVRDGKFQCSAQFGEGSAGVGEFFAIVCIAMDKKFDVGQELRGGLPKANGYTKLKIVKRSN